MTLPTTNKGRWRWVLLRRLFPNGVEAIITTTLTPGDIGLVQFGKPGRYNTVDEKES